MAALNPGEAIALSGRVTRVVAPNGGPMTGPGTNSYLLGRERLALIDPGPASPAHLDALRAAIGERPLDLILVTHTHPDHSPGAAVLARETGAELVGSVMADDGHQDTSFDVERNVRDGEQIQTEEFTLSAVHTPGHVGNHFCFLLEEEQMLFTGDHIINGSTVVILPPSGDMADYLLSLKKLQELELAALAPGHGDLITDPLGALDALIEHRLKRERKLLAVLRKHRDGTLSELLPAVYDDVSPALHKVAQYSLWAHLLKLERDGLARKHAEEHWLFHDEHWTYLGD